MRQRGQFPGQFDRRPAGRITARIACQGGNPVYPREPNGDADDAPGQDHGQELLVTLGGGFSGIDGGTLAVSRRALP